MLNHPPQVQQPQIDDSSLPPHSTDPDIELPRVLLALQTVYNSYSLPPSSSSHIPPFDRRDVADRYLTSFQRTPVAWLVCDRLLLSSDDNNKDGGGGATNSTSSSDANVDSTLRTQRQFFAAQTLHAKCLR